MVLRGEKSQNGPKTTVKLKNEKPYIIFQWSTYATIFLNYIAMVTICVAMVTLNLCFFETNHSYELRLIYFIITKTPQNKPLICYTNPWFRRMNMVQSEYMYAQFLISIRSNTLKSQFSCFLLPWKRRKLGPLKK